MSTILNTLKKLEEEKSVLEKNIDLKGLLLQGQDNVTPQSTAKASRKWRTLGGIIIGGMVLGGLGVYFFGASETVSPDSKQASVFNPPASPPVKKKPLANAKSYPGFPLAYIPDSAPTEIVDPYRDDEFFEPEDTLTLPPEPAPQVIIEPEPVGSKEIQEIESLIQIATQDIENVAETPDKITIIAPNRGQNIPGLRVKGIIFLNPDNPVNHIFVSTPSETNRKLKVGDTLLDATLESIEAQKAVFSHQGQRVEKSLGE